MIFIHKVFVFNLVQEPGGWDTTQQWCLCQDCVSLFGELSAVRHALSLTSGAACELKQLGGTWKHYKSRQLTDSTLFAGRWSNRPAVIYQTLEASRLKVYF